MKPSLTLKVSQQLQMTPQLQQAIRLLQLSSLELTQEIQQAIESNPLLEFSEQENEIKEATPNSLQNAEPSRDSELSQYSQPTSNKQKSSREPSTDWQQQQAEEINLWAHLKSQLHLMQLSEENLQIGYALIDNINENGFLTLPLEDIYNDDLENNFDNDADESLEDKVKNLEWILHLIQKLDPEGVGSRNAEEFIALQLQSQPKSETQKLALKIVQNDLTLLSEHRFPALMKKYRLNKTQFKEVFSLIKNLRPSPLSGTSFEAKEEYIHPDVLCYRDGERWDVTLNQHNIPKIGINQAYSQMVKTVDQSDTQAYIKSHLQEARWFIKSIESRNQTLLKVAKYIVDFQQDFLDHGEQAMKPMILHDVAEAVEMHESTISRITTRKYMHTPRGIFELKYFFSSHLETDTGMHCSTTAIKAQIKKLISEEPANQPYSDDKLVQMLSKQGIKIARRTIAKYRELMNIPSSAQRKRKNWTQS